MKKIIIAITICIIGGFIVGQYVKTPYAKPPIPADIDDALVTWAIINAATKEQKECNLYIDRYQISTTTGVLVSNSQYVLETILDTYTGEGVSRKMVATSYYTK